jgi:hypothetical protein
MNCNQIRERMLDVAAGFGEPTADEGNHLESCSACADQLKAMRRPVLTAALTVLLGVGIGLFFTRGGIVNRAPEAINIINTTEAPARGTAVSDLQTLDKNNDLYADFDLLDDLDLQQDVVANP